MKYLPVASLVSAYKAKIIITSDIQADFIITEKKAG
jgi:hypothetical protein